MRVPPGPRRRRPFAGAGTPQPRARTHPDSRPPPTVCECYRVVKDEDDRLPG
jgi:hypothetical protein